MFQARSIFESSLRNNGTDFLSPKHVEHRKCKGHVHGRGSYRKTTDVDDSATCKDDTALPSSSPTAPKRPPFALGRKFASFSEKSRTGKLVVARFRNDDRKRAPPASSLSSDDFSACSSTDSVDTIAKCGDNGNVGDRLYARATKSSQAKTLNDDEAGDTDWIAYLSREAVKSDVLMKRLLEKDDRSRTKRDEKKLTEQISRMRRREKLKRVLGDKIVLKSTLDLTNNGDASKNKVDVEDDGDAARDGKSCGQPPPVPPKPKHIEARMRSARKHPFINRLMDRAKSAPKPSASRGVVTLAEAQFAAINRKSLLPGTENVLFKDVGVLTRERKEDDGADDPKIRQQRPDVNSVWLMHRDGIKIARKLRTGNGEQSAVDVSFVDEKSGDAVAVQVDEDDLEKATDCDPTAVNDLSSLIHLNESNVVNVLTARYSSNGVHTLAGNKTLVVIEKQLDEDFTDEQLQTIKTCKYKDDLTGTWPHYKTLIAAAFDDLLRERRDQSIVYFDRRRDSYFRALTFLLSLASQRNRHEQRLTATKLHAIETLLRQFASDALQTIKIDCDRRGAIVASALEVHASNRTAALLSPSDGTKANDNARPLLAIRTLTAQRDDEQLRRDLYLDAFERSSRGDDAQSDFAGVTAAFERLDVNGTEQRIVWRVLSAALHLQRASTTKSATTQKLQFANLQSAQRAAKLLGLTFDELSRHVFADHKPSGGKRGGTGADLLRCYAMALYEELVQLIVYLINRSISTPSSSCGTNAIAFVAVPVSRWRDVASTFDDFRCDYLHERLQKYHRDVCVTRNRELYVAERIVCGDVDECFASDHATLLDVVDRCKSAKDPRPGWWQILQDEAPTIADPQALIARLLAVCSDKRDECLMRKSRDDEFVVYHQSGAKPVLYAASDWLRACRSGDRARLSVSNALAKSSKDALRDAFQKAKRTKEARQAPPAVGRKSLRHSARMDSSPRLPTKSLADDLIATLKPTNPWFVVCLAPDRAAASGTATDVDVPFLRLQLRMYRLLEISRAFKMGYAHAVPLTAFRRRFANLVATTDEPATTVDSILAALNVPTANYKIGATKVFFRKGVLNRLDRRLDASHEPLIVNLQANCRGFLARKRLERRKVQELAIDCVQRNVRIHRETRDWPWWRLFLKLRPLLVVNRTEEELKTKAKELEALKTKCDRIELQNAELKLENDRLEAKLSEMTADLAEEQSTSTMATAKLDVEASERKRLQRDLNDVQERNKTLEENSQRLELELLTAKSDLNGISEEPNETSGTDSDDGVYKKRFERATKELEFTKKRLQQQHEDDLEQLIGLKKQLEKKLTDAYEEVEEQRQVVSQWKRKVQKLNGEMNDLKVLLEEQNARNNVLEKKQRKFDAEMQMIHDELKQERSQKDRLQREKDVLAAEKFALEGTLADVRLELELKEERLTALQVDYDELTYGGKTEEEVTILRRQKIDCERRLHDQHEELDDLAGQVQLLEQTKLKLEMALEQQRKSAKRETQQHEDEMEDVRSNAQKKIKALESQLENEHEERTLLVKEKHELERRLIEIMEADRNEKACDEALFHRLKRDLKRTKALLKDTQAQLERVTSENPSKSVVRQLKNQLEDVECARNVALKAKQHLENELLETQNQLEDVVKQKTDAEEKMNACVKERCELQAQVEENEEEMAEMLKKYKTAVQQMSMDQAALQEQVCLVTELEMERNKLREQLNELTLKLENAESVGGASSHMILKKGELKLKELESKLELEQTTRSRLEVQMARLKDAMEKLQIDLNNSRIREHASQETTRKLQRTLRELKEELNGTAAKETETLQKRKEMEKKYEALEGETVTLRQDLKVALKRIADLQAAIQGELEDSVSDHSDSEKENYSSDESVNTFLLNHKPPSSSNNNNGGINRSTSDSGRRSSNTSRSSTSSFLGNS